MREEEFQTVALVLTFIELTLDTTQVDMSPLNLGAILNVNWKHNKYEHVSVLSNDKHQKGKLCVHSCLRHINSDVLTSIDVTLETSQRNKLLLKLFAISNKL